MRAPEADSRTFSTARHLGFDGAPHRPRMGLRPAGNGAWLEPDANRAWQLALKAELIAADRPRFVCPAVTRSAARGTARLRELLDAELGADGPNGIAADDPIEACGRSTQEDWCVMVREDTWRLRAACVCFPSRWVLAEKIGATVAEIHGPVDRYDSELGGLVESFFDRLRPGRLMWRMNWNLWDDPRLSQPFRDSDAPAYEPPPAAEVGERVFLRVERQTMLRLTDDAVAFGIRVHQRPLGRLLGEAGAVATLRSTLGGAEGAARLPKKLGPLAEPILAWLDLVDASPAPGTG